MPDRGQTKRGVSWLSLIYYLLVAPAALQVLARLDEHFEFSAFIGRLLRAWRDFVHGMWADLIAALRSVIELHPTANQIDALSWMFLMLGAAASSAAFGPPKLVLRANPVQAAVLFWFAFLFVAVIFLRPYGPALWRYLGATFADLGLVRTIAGAILLAYIMAFTVTHLVRTIREARAARADADDLTPFWSDIESLLVPSMVGVSVGAILALPVLESEAAVDRVAQAQDGGIASPQIMFSVDGVLAPLVMMSLFALSLLLLRRYNWPIMVRQVATALGILLADRLIVAFDPLWRSWFAPQA